MNHQEIIEKIVNAEWKLLDEKTKYHSGCKSFPASGTVYSGRIETRKYLLEAVPKTESRQQIAVYVTNVIDIPLHWDHETPHVDNYIDVDYRGVCGNDTFKGLFKDRIKKEFNGKPIRVERVI